MRGDAEPTKSVWQNRPLANCRRNSTVRLCFRKILNGNPQWGPFDPGHCRGTATAEERGHFAALALTKSDKLPERISMFGSIWSRVTQSSRICCLVLLEE